MGDASQDGANERRNRERALRFRRSALVVLAATAAAASCLSVVQGAAADRPDGRDQSPAVGYRGGELLVGYKSGVGAGERLDSRRKLDATLDSDLGFASIQLLDLPPNVSVAKAMERAERDPNVAFAEPNHVRHLQDLTPNDPHFGELWGLNNSGQAIQGQPGTPDADIDATDAWQVAGLAPTRVAVIDSGIDFNHPDLAGSIWRNPGESGKGKESNGRDDDGNGFVDDWRGWDFVNGDNMPEDGYGHGTHVAGTIGARSDNGIGIAGVDGRAKVIPLRVCDSTGSCPDAQVAQAFRYAGKIGAKIANVSLSGDDRSRTFAAAIRTSSTTTFVVSAGNNSKDVGAAPLTSPCAEPGANIVCVGASDNNDNLAGFSNYGSRVDIAAPGVSVLSTVPADAPLGSRSGYRYLNGTSMAAPHVSGAAALLLGANPELRPRQVISALRAGADVRPTLKRWIRSGLRLNLRGALALASGATSRTGVLDGELWFQARPGESNSVSVRQSGTSFDVEDATGAIAAASGCLPLTARSVRCADTSISSIRLELGSGDDRGSITSSLPATINGDSGDDALTGGNGDDQLSGGSGDDRLLGGGGSDTLDGEGGTDQLDGSAGTDTIDYSSATAPVVVDLTAGTGGTAGEHDSFADVENVRGGAGDDLLLGTADRNVIDGGAGDDRLDGSGGNDLANGGSGLDVVDYSARSAPVDVDLAAGTGGTAGEHDSLVDVEGAIGGSAADALAGDATANTLDGGPGDDSIDGRGGPDVVDYSARSAPVDVDLAAGTGGTAGEHDSLTSVENARGGSGADALRGDGGTNSTDGGPGDDSIDGRGGSDTVDYSARSAPVDVDLAAGTGGTAGEHDSLVDIEGASGGSVADALAGDATANTLDGGPGDDSIDGRGGSDTVDYSHTQGDARIDLAAGTAATGAGNDSLSSIENVLGALGTNVVHGDGGPNVLIGGSGGSAVWDQLYGGGGDDVVVALNGHAQFFGQAGNDTLVGGALADYAAGGDGNDSILGLGSSDILSGGPGDDAVHGGGPHFGTPDQISGEGGSDLLSGDGGGAYIDALDGEVDTLECGYNSGFKGDAIDVLRGDCRTN